jgi:hypothetical protein
MVASRKVDTPAVDRALAAIKDKTVSGARTAFTLLARKASVHLLSEAHVVDL